jgi:glycosyltransferase involved in cell wall biosynthesis
MKRVLCISPHFPPVNAADMHRLRQLLPYFKEFGWQPIVFGVNPIFIEAGQDNLLTTMVPGDIEVRHVSAFPPSLTRKFGLGNLGFRSWLQYRQAIDRYLAQTHVDLIFFSTTVFTVITLGPHWKRKFGVPFVVDLQDPWRNDYYLGVPASERQPKFWFDYRQKKILERLTMPHVDGILAVSAHYIDVLRERYAMLRDRESLVLPFGAMEDDIAIASQLPAVLPENDRVRVVYVGRGGRDMTFAFSVLFIALAKGLERAPQLFSRIHVYLFGTSYAPDGEGKKTTEPIAEKYGVARLVSETTDRLPYFRALRALLDADILFVPGSDDPSYTASKIFPYILAKKPTVAVFRSSSSTSAILRDTQAGEVIGFDENCSLEEASEHCLAVLENFLRRIPFAPQTCWDRFEPYTARSMAEKTARFFDSTLSRSRAS